MATYKVKNETGQEFEVDEDKLDLAEKDGFLPVVTNGKQEHRVSFSDIGLAKKDGYLPKTAESFLEAKDAFFDNLNQMIPGSGLIDKAAAATNAGIQEIGDLFRDDENKKDFKDRYQGYLDTQDTERKVMDEKYPVASTAGTVAGIVPNAMIPVPFGKAGGLIGAGQRIMANTAISAADSATRNKDELIDEEAGLEGGAIGGGISTAVESLPLVGKAAKAVKRMLPGTEEAYDWVNKAAANAGSLVPGTDMDSKDLYNLLKNKDARVAARKAKVNSEGQDKVFEAAAEHLKSLDNYTDDFVSKLYAKAEFEMINNVNGKEIPKLALASKQLEKQGEIINQRPELFGRAKKIIDNVNEIIARGDITEIQQPTANKAISDLAELFGVDGQAQTLAHRLLASRRYIDDVTKNVDFDKMLKSERDEIFRARDFINNAFDSIDSAKPLREADDFYSKFTQQKKNAFNKLEVPLPSGGRDFTPEKIEQFFKSEAAQAKFVQREMEKFGQLMLSKGDDSIKQMSETINKGKDIFSLVRDLDDLKRASGGPSSQAINTVLQALGAYSTSGFSLLALPITNPSAWMKLVDSLSNTVASPFIQKITEASKQLVERSPQVATRLYLMGQKD